uniref:hypothetical protein n=1 Tax=Nocardia suismassiliense TaxID=2077092 RepID=UPI003F49450E
MNALPQPTASERNWLAVREYLRQHRFDLSVAAAESLPTVEKVAGTALLTKHEWVPSAPIPLGSVAIHLESGPTIQYPSLLEAARAGLPRRADGSQYSSYADAIGELAPPKVFENRTTYRLLEADLSAEQPVLRFGRGTYFDSINTGESAAHEFAEERMGSSTGTRIRDEIGDPCDLSLRPANLAISTLTIRHDAATGEDTFLLHWRDPAKVGHAGGMYQVVPVGVFQPSGEATWNWRNDFSLWHNVIREFGEELGGQSEDHGSESAPIDYQRWEFAARLDKAVAEGYAHSYCLGMGVDPLSYATDLLTAVVIDAAVFDDLFGNVVGGNEEGHVLDAKPLTAGVLAHTVSNFRLQAAGAAILRLTKQLTVVQH